MTLVTYAFWSWLLFGIFMGYDDRNCTVSLPTLSSSATTVCEGGPLPPTPEQLEAARRGDLLIVYPDGRTEGDLTSRVRPPSRSRGAR